MLRQIALPLLLVILTLQGCAYGIYDDKRLLDTMRQDKSMASSIKAALLKDNFNEGWPLSVYVFYGNVFLVGEIPENMRAKAVAIARSFDPRSVTPHWFSSMKSDRSNIALATELRGALIAAKGLSSTRIDTEVNAGRVVLLGVVHDDEEKRIAIATARKINGVTSVTSYLMLPPKSHGATPDVSASAAHE